MSMPFHTHYLARLLRLLIAALLVAGMVVLPAPAAQAASISVTAGGNLQVAVNNAAPGDVIRITGNPAANQTVDLSLMGSAIAGSTGNLTIIAANGPGSSTLSGSGSRFITSGSFNGVLTLDGLTLSTSSGTEAPAVNITAGLGLIIVNSSFNTVGNSTTCPITGPSACLAIYYATSSGTSSVSLLNNTFTNIGSDAVNIAISGTANNTITVAGNTFTDDGTDPAFMSAGVVISGAGSSIVNASVVNNGFSNLSGIPVDVIADDTAVVNASVVNNTISSLTATSLGAIHAATANTSSSPNLNTIITDNTINGTQAAGIQIDAQSSGSAVITAQILRNSLQNINYVSGSTQPGIYLNGVPGATGSLTAQVQGNTLANIGSSGIYQETLGPSFATVISGNSVASANIDGFATDAGIMSVVRSAITLTTAVQTNCVDASGIGFRQFDTAQLRVETDGTAVSSYIPANNSGAGCAGAATLLPGFGTATTVALNTVARQAEQHVPTADADITTAIIGAVTTINVLANDSDVDTGTGDTINLLAFQPVSARGATITRNDNGTPANLIDDRLTFTPLVSGAGVDTFAYIVRDTGGRSSINSVTVTVVSDTTPPDTSITGTPSNPSNDTTPTFSFTGNDNYTAPASLTYQCKIDSGAFGSCTSPFTSSALADGTHTFQVGAVDQAGNIDPTPATYTWVIDSTAPDTSFTTTPPVATNLNTATFTFTGNDGSGSGIASFECSFDAAPFASCTSPANFASLSEGSHTFAVRALDAVGTRDPTPASYTWTVDQTTPDTTITGNPPLLSNSSSATFTFSGSDPAGSGVAAFECALDSGSYSACTSPLNLTALGEGPHTVEVRAIDAAGNLDPSPASYSWTIDTLVPPAPVVTAPANGSITNNNQPPISGTAEASSTVTVYLDGNPIGTTSASAVGSWSFSPPTALSDGPHTVYARATDASGNTGVASNTNTFTVDTAEPDTTFTITPPAVSNSSSASFSFSANDSSGVNHLECKLDTAAFATCVSPVNLTSLSAGSHTFQVRAVDNAGNTETTPASYTWTVDQTTPDTTITGNPPLLSNSSSATFTFSGSDPAGSGVAAFECALDSGSYSACTSPLNLTALGEGAHTVEVRAIDAAGNLDPSPASYSWTIDTLVPPAPVVTTPANGSITNNAQPQISGTAEASSTVTVYLDGSPIGTTSASAVGSWSFSPPTALSDGPHTVYARATDASGNTGVASNTNTFTVDTTAPPAPVVTTPANGSVTSSTQPPISGTAEAGSTVTVIIDGSPVGTTTANGAGTWSFIPPTPLSDATHTARAHATDAAGNTGVGSNTNSFTVDTTAPAAPVVVAPANGASVNSATPSTSGTAEPNSTVTIYIDGSSVGATTASAAGIWSFTLGTALIDGVHAVKATSIDDAGNTSPNSNTNSFTVDTIAPTTTLTSTPSDPSNSDAPTFSFTGADSGSGLASFECKLDTGPFATCTSPKSYAGLADGSHTFEVRAIDAAGNADATPASFTWVVDTTSPTTTITSNPPIVTNSTSATFGFTGADGSGTGVASFECKLDTGAFVACTSPTTFTGLAEGSHTFEVQAIDTVGNVDASPATYTWTIDLTAPDTTITAQPALKVNSSSAAFSFSGSDNLTPGASLVFECKLDTGAFVACTSPQNYTGLTDGTHTFEVRAVDLAGNSDATPASYTWEIDTTPLTVAIDQAAAQADPTGAAPVSFTVVFNKPVTGFGDVAGDLSLSGTAPGTLSATVTGGPTSYAVSVSGMTGPGTVIASVNASAANDLFGNSNSASTSTDATVTFAPTNPVVTGMVRTSASPTSAASLSWDVTFSTDVSGVDANDFALVASGVSGATITGVTGSGTTYVVSVSTGSGSGTLQLNLVDNDTILGVQSGIALGGAGSGNGNFSGDVYAIDRIDPAASLGTLDPVLKTTASYTFTVSYSDNLALQFSTLDSSDILVSGPGGFSQLAQLVSATPAADGTPIQAIYRITAPGATWQYTDNGQYTIALQASQIGDTAGNQAAAATLGTFTIQLGVQVFLPLVTTSPALPDLIVQQISTINGQLSVTIKNIGGSAATQPFWVDLYINPTTAPTKVNEIWQTRGLRGLTWGVTAPIPAGGSLTLTIGDSFFRPLESNQGGPITAGTPIYAQVDSANTKTTYGAVLEIHERDNGPYNNISLTNASSTINSVQQTAALGPQERGNLPARQDGDPEAR